MNPLPEHPEPGAALIQMDELLFRNVRQQFFQNDHVSSQAFEPSSADNGLLSVDRGSMTTPKAAFERFLLLSKETKSSGVLAVSVDECRAQEVPALENALPENPAHAVADFRAHKNSQTKKRAGKLRDMARTRGWQHRAK